MHPFAGFGEDLLGRPHLTLRIEVRCGLALVEGEGVASGFEDLAALGDRERRLARSLSYLLDVVESLRMRGAHVKSLADPIDTSGPSGVLVLQMLDAVAEFERSLIRERTVVGVRAARARGRVGGNPGLRARDPVVLGKLAASRRATRLARLTAEMEARMPVVRLCGRRRRGRRSPWR
jgi:DNA invertase Pin-like site-specific DNA recombinase